MARRNEAEKADRPERPERPCAAFFVMQSILPESYFRTRAPEHGVSLRVTGKDSVSTLWSLPSRLAGPVAHRAQELGCNVLVLK